jgi:hypothetical protein
MLFFLDSADVGLWEKVPERQPVWEGQTAIGHVIDIQYAVFVDSADVGLWEKYQNGACTVSANKDRTCHKEAAVHICVHWQSGCVVYRRGPLYTCCCQVLGATLRLLLAAVA